MRLMSILETIKNGDAKRAAELLDADPGLAAGRTPEGVSYVCIAMYHGQPEIGRLLESKRQDLDLYEACTIGALSRVRELISEQSATVNSFSPDGFAPVALAAYFGHPDIVETLIGAGADVNAQARNPMKVAAIHAAVSARNVGCVELLLRSGADPNLAQQEGFTPMKAAVANKDEAIIKLLEAHGAR